MIFRSLVVLSALLLPLCTARSNFFSEDAVADFGAPGYTCDPSLMKPSKTVPTNVNSVRPGDINLIMALGDSLTAANGAGATTKEQVALEYRGLGFLAGGDLGLDTHITIPNIMMKFNPLLFGYSNGIGTQYQWKVARLNVAVPGATASDLPGQARHLVQLLNEHKESIHMQNDWKLLNIFIGGNDMCRYCVNRNDAPDLCINHIKEAIQIIYDNVPRVIVSLTAMLQLELLRQTDVGEGVCQGMHRVECECESDATFTSANISQACYRYADDEISLAASGVFDKPDFTLVTQPFFRNILSPPMKNGQIYHGFFAPDCFHFSKYGHSMVSSWLWKNMMEPVGAKTVMGSMTNPAIPLACPAANCPFIRTNLNSQDCSKYTTQ